MSKARTFREFKQGIFKPVNKNKCLNTEFVVYRSSLELSVMLFLDKSDKVKKWGSETTVIPYFKEVEQRPARYFIDFTITLENNGKLETWLVEVKPEKETLPPTNARGTKKQSTIMYESMTWITNNNKWESAKKYAEKKGYKFVLMTEKNIHHLIGK